MRRRRQSIPANRVDLEIEIQDSDRQLANTLHDKAHGRWMKCCRCGNYFMAKLFQFSCGCKETYEPQR